ncbi:THAP domain-containing protein 2-like isoform X2 [Chelmon rostratus]|uniref:THAP domain-containing protein 2-like isoform X2 n=1 Tax=Chelmon rostratus TaxID=109905 RepID=UPI001BECA0C3|nr:THAP domain-containing protein 2-like isoform X2 [Chelmon rostratus]
MLHFCAAVGCCGEISAKTKEQFPKDKVKRQAWKAALRRKEFEPNDRSVICSCHFKPEDFDMTGQTTRIKEGVIPSVFIFSDHLSKVPNTSGSTKTSQKAAAQGPDVRVQLPEDHEVSASDHQYALDPVKVKKKLTEAQERVEELQRILRNAKDRERRRKKVVKSLLKDLKHKNMLTKELQQELDLYSDLPD